MNPNEEKALRERCTNLADDVEILDEACKALAAANLILEEENAMLIDKPKKEKMIKRILGKALKILLFVKECAFIVITFLKLFVKKG